MSVFPLMYVIGWRPYLEGATNAHNNPIDAWGDAVNVDVYGWAQPSSSEPKIIGRDQVVVDVEIFAPPDVAIRAHDRIVIRGAEYAVEGEPENYNHGPWGWRPGCVINGRRVEG